MNIEDFYFDLPEELIAQYPLAQRSDSRLLVYQKQSQAMHHGQFTDVLDVLHPGDLLVMNDSKVIPARLYGYKATGGKVELLIERVTGTFTFLAHIKASKALKPGGLVFLSGDHCLELIGRQDDLFLCRSTVEVDRLLQECGHIPLPPYIDRSEESLDRERYQTVYAKTEGSVAAPTAGLHFDNEILDKLIARGIHIAYLTLHVGSGTFRPVRCERIIDHKMHSERYTITPSLCDMVHETKARGHRVIAVGTTALRSLESAARQGALVAGGYETDIFIYPGFSFKLCDGLLTNFHLPGSTLLMLVSAFIGHDNAMRLYREAVAQKYRFFSYGDASLLI